MEGEGRQLAGKTQWRRRHIAAIGKTWVSVSVGLPAQVPTHPTGQDPPLDFVLQSGHWFSSLLRSSHWPGVTRFFTWRSAVSPFGSQWSIPLSSSRSERQQRIEVPRHYSEQPLQFILVASCRPRDKILGNEHS